MVTPTDKIVTRICGHVKGKKSYAIRHTINFKISGWGLEISRITMSGEKGVIVARYRKLVWEGEVILTPKILGLRPQPD